jgi:putative peptide zinc metalloprotease protein
MRRRLLIVLLALLAAFGAPGLAHADPGSDAGLGGGANAAIAINTKDDSSLFKLAFSIRHVMNGIVDQQNGAVAYSQCTSCQTTAIALQIVLVEAPASTVSPTNVAVAVNSGCTLCDTFATAYQFVIGTSGPVHFTQAGLQALHDIRKEIAQWGKDGLTNDQIRAKLPDVIARVKDILAHQLVADGKAAPHQPDETQTDTTGGQPNAPPTGPTATTDTGTVQETVTTPTDTTTDTTPTTTTAPTTTTGPTGTGTGPTPTTTTP